MLNNMKSYLINPANYKSIVLIASVIVILILFIWLLKKSFKFLLVGVVVALVISTLAKNGMFMYSVEKALNSGKSVVSDLQKKYNSNKEEEQKETKANKVIGGSWGWTQD